jgi:hypothetical protein
MAVCSAEEDAASLAITYHDEGQLRKQQRVLAATKTRNSGGEARGSELSLSLESMSQQGAGGDV